MSNGNLYLESFPQYFCQKCKNLRSRFNFPGRIGHNIWIAGGLLLLQSYRVVFREKIYNLKVMKFVCLYIPFHENHLRYAFFGMCQKRFRSVSIVILEMTYQNTRILSSLNT